MAPSISITFPDGAKREFPAGTTGAAIAGGISPSLLKRTVAMALDGEVMDLADPSPTARASSSSTARTRARWS